MSTGSGAARSAYRELCKSPTLSRTAAGIRQCHRHPHDVWQQDDLLSFANFFMGVRKVGFEGDNEQRYPEDAKLFKQFEAEGKKLAEEVKTLKESEGKQLAEKAKAAQQELQKLKKEPNAHPAKIVELEKTIAENDALQKSISEKGETRSLAGRRRGQTRRPRGDSVFEARR